MGDGKRREVGDIVRDQRLALGLSQRELADATGLSVGMLRDLEQGRTRRPYSASLRRLSEVLGVDLRAESASERGGGHQPAVQLKPVGASEARSKVQFLILGVMEASANGAVIPLGSGKRRTLLAYLALNAGVVISRDTLIDVLWGDTPPHSAVERIGEYVRKARELLCPAPAGGTARQPELIERVGRGYRLNTQLCHRDADEFLLLSERGRAALSVGLHHEAAELLEQALKLWRGEIMPDIEALKDHPEVVSLRRRRSGTVQDIADALSMLGRHDEALSHLEAAVARDPFDEAIQGQMLLTLARCGRQSEALSRYQRFSQLLNDELAIGPGKELADIQRRILHQELEPSSGVALRPAAVPRQLPAVSSLFTGRDTEIRAVVGYVDRSPDERAFDTVPIVTIDGMAGVGKTALAVRVAHHLAGRYPDGQLFVNLHGFSIDRPPRQAHQVLEELLQTLGVPMSLVPTDTEARAALYRDRLAATRTLVVLDDAATADQVRPLLPSSGSCLVLVTSRRRLKALDEAFPLALTAVGAEDANRLLAQMVSRGPEPTGGNEDLRDLVALCGRLPLALRIVGALLRQRPWLTPAAVAERLRSSLTEPNPLAVFDDGDRSLVPIFDLSYQALRGQQQHMFRALGGFPGPHIDVFAAAALTGTDVRTAENLLLDLVDHNLLTEIAPGRFQLHDLIRLYAKMRGNEHGGPVQARATERLLEYFDTTARRAHDVLARRVPWPEPGAGGGPKLDTHEQATAWMKSNASNVLAIARLAAQARDHRRVLSLSGSLYGFLRIHGSWSDALELLELAIGAAESGGDPASGAVARMRLGVIRRLAGDFCGSVAALQDAMTHLRADPGSPLLMTGLRELGETYRLQGDYPRAEESLRAALAHRALDDDPLARAGILTSLGSLALTSSVSDPLAAIELLQEAIRLYSENEDRAGAVTASFYLGDLHRVLGNYADARRVLESALQDARGVQDRLVHANVLSRLGYLRHLLGDREAADRAFREALDTCMRMGSLIGEANTLVYMGVTRAAGEHANALDILRRAQAIYTSLGSERGRAMGLMYAAEVMHDAGDRDEARKALSEAITILEAAGDTVNEAYALTLKGAFAFTEGAFGQAHDHYDGALALARRSHRRVTEAIALRGIGTAAAAVGDVAKAAEFLGAALQLYRNLGSPIAEAVGSELAALAPVYGD